jgi:hypothetical protein
VAVPPQTPTDIPYQFTAGTTVKFQRQFQSYPATEGWNYKVFFNGPTQNFEADGTQDADTDSGAGLNSWTVTLSKTVTAVAPGWYKISEQVSNQAGEVYDVNDPQDLKHTNILPNPATAPAGSFITWEQKTLGILQQAISGNMSQNVQSYQIAGRAVSHYSITELMKLAGTFKAIVWRQQHPGYLGERYAIHFPPEQSQQPFPPTWVDTTGFIPPP